ncbi:MAG: selenoneine biosynthesis selenosugar synthase SenB [Gammaproteobacteria bacterium]
MAGKHILIISPATESENNGNWQTSRRWSLFLRERHRVAIAPGFDPTTVNAPDLLIALHARRSAGALAAFRQTHGERATVLVLTGTDLYRDIATDPEAQAALEHATVIVLLQAAGLAMLPPHLRAKARVIHQSAPTLPSKGEAARGRQHHDICMIGHLRPEKDPLTFMRASELVTNRRVRLVHIGGALDAALGDAAADMAARNPRYEWLGALPNAAARQRLKRSHAMAITSLMEGGANVIIEAVTSGVPVLASDINGNRGMLGEDYAGYFPVGDAQALAQLIDRTIDDPAFHQLLTSQCAARAPLFDPAAERAAVLDLVDNLLLAYPSKLPPPPVQPQRITQ